MFHFAVDTLVSERQRLAPSSEMSSVTIDFDRIDMVWPVATPNTKCRRSVSQRDIKQLSSGVGRGQATVPKHSRPWPERKFVHASIVAPGTDTALLCASGTPSGDDDSCTIRAVPNMRVESDRSESCTCCHYLAGPRNYSLCVRRFHSASIRSAAAPGASCSQTRTTSHSRDASA